MAYVSVVPALIDALIAQAGAAVTTAKVYDGVGVTDDAGDYLMIGVEDPDSDDWTSAATTQRRFESVGGGANNDITEEGDIPCVALSWNGNGSQKQARDAVYAIAEALAGVCRTNPTLGVDRVMWTLYGSDGDLQYLQDDNGAAARLPFSIHFQALI